LIIKSYFLDEAEREQYEMYVLEQYTDLDLETILALDDQELLQLHNA
jgi:hypothetical protein